MDIEQHREIALADCKNVEEIDRAAEAAAELLLAGGAVELALAPGNGTRYCFLLAPIDGMARFGTAGFESRGVEPPGGVWFAYLNGTPAAVYPVKLLGREWDDPAPSYIAEKWNGGRLSDDVFVIERLFHGIAAHSREAVTP